MDFLRDALILPAGKNFSMELQGEVYVVISINTSSPSASCWPGVMRSQSSPEMVTFSPTAPGKIEVTLFLQFEDTIQREKTQRSFRPTVNLRKLMVVANQT